MFKQAMMGEAVKGLTAAIVGLLFGIFVTGKFGTTELEYKVNTKEGYFNIPQQVKNDLRLEHQGKPIANISVIDVSILNRVKDIGPTTVYFQLIQKSAPLPKLISVDVVPPENLPNVGISKEQSADPALYAFRFATIKQQQHNEFYRARFIFEGETAPDVLPTTNEKDVIIVPYKDSRDWVTAIFWVGLFYAALFGGMWLWDARTSQRRREKLVQEFRDLVMQKHQHAGSLLPPTIASTEAVECYQEFIQPKPGFFSKIFRRKSSRVEGSNDGNKLQPGGPGDAAQ